MRYFCDTIIHAMSLISYESWRYISVAQVIQVIQVIQLIQVMQVRLAHLWPGSRLLIELWMFLWDIELWRFLCCSLWVVEMEEEINWLRTVRCLDWCQYEKSAYHLHFQALSYHFHSPNVQIVILDIRRSTLLQFFLYTKQINWLMIYCKKWRLKWISWVFFL